MAQTTSLACRVGMAALAALLGCSSRPADSPSPGSSGQPTPTVVRVAAAADLRFAFAELAAAFHEEHPEIELQPTFGSSGSFYTQLTQHAPFDLYLSADSDYPRRLVDQGLAVESSLFVYAIGHLVVWVRNDSPLDIERLGMRALLEPEARRIALANPRHAPYGRAAEAALRSAGLYEQIEERLVLGDNVAQTAQFVQSGAADVGVIALSLAMGRELSEQGRRWPIPEEAHPRLEQAGVILAGSPGREAAEVLRSFLISDRARSILERFGFAPPGKTVEPVSADQGE